LAIDRPNRALIPSKIAPAYSVAPVSQVRYDPNAANEKKADKFRKLKSTMKMMGRR
jgi:hypothetical protein